MAVIAMSYFSFLWFFFKFSSFISHLLSTVSHRLAIYLLNINISFKLQGIQTDIFIPSSFSFTVAFAFAFFYSHSAKIKIVKIKDTFPYLKVVVLPKRLRWLLICEPPPQHRIDTGHIVPFESITPNYFYIIPILLSIYALFVFWLLLHSEQIFSLALSHP